MQILEQCFCQAKNPPVIIVEKSTTKEEVEGRKSITPYTTYSTYHGINLATVKTAAHHSRSTSHQRMVPDQNLYRNPPGKATYHWQFGMQ